jgi:hypothetical protein
MYVLVATSPNLMVRALIDLTPSPQHGRRKNQPRSALQLAKILLELLFGNLPRVMGTRAPYNQSIGDPLLPLSRLGGGNHQE